MGKRRRSSSAWRRAGCSLPAVLLTLLLTPACGGAPEPTAASYRLQFPSVAAAASTDTVELYLHAGDEREICQELTLKRISKQPLPEDIVELPATSPCEILAGGGPNLDIAYGPTALLVVGRRSGDDFVIGCTRFEATSEPFEVVVTLTLAGSSVAPPSSTCKELSDKCEGRC